MEWRQIEIKDFLGRQTSTVNPPKNACQQIENLDVRNYEGELQSRYGYDRKYAPPTDTRAKWTVASSGHLSFSNFYIPDLGGGQEITVAISKGALVGETQIEKGTPDSINILSVFIRPYWAVYTTGTVTASGTTATNVVSNITATLNQYANKYLKIGTELKKITSNTAGAAAVFTTEAFDTLPTGAITIMGWNDSWRWLNQCVLTKINTVETDTWKMQLDFADSTLKTDGFNNWSIVNCTKSPKQIAKVIDTYADEDPTAHRVCVEISQSNNTWAAGDTVLLMRNYIPYEYLTGMYNVTTSEITYHKVLNDLRIGFGGQANRLGLSIGYRKKGFRLQSIAFGSYTTQIQPLAEIDEIILDPYNCVGTDAEFDIVPIYEAGSPLTASIYYFKLIAKLDDYESFVIEEATLDINSNRSVAVNFKVNFGSMNKRITDVSVYWSSDNILFYKLYELEFSKKIYEANKFKLDVDGDFTILATISSTNLNTVSNAVLPGTDADATTGWSHTNSTQWSFASVEADPTPTDSVSCFKILRTGATTTSGQDTIYTTLAYLVAGQRYTISLKARGYHSGSSSTNNPMSIYLGFGPDGNNLYYENSWQETIDNSGWKIIEKEIEIISATNNVFGIECRAYSVNSWMAIDAFSITQTSKDLTLDADANTNSLIDDDLGYSPTLNYAKSWDQVIITKGRSFMVNAYFTERYTNKIFFSPISGLGERQYDVITALNFYDLENFDGNDLVAIDLLRSGNFLSLKRSSPLVLDSDTGRTRDVYLGKGCINRRGVVNVGEAVVYPGENDIHICDDLRVEDLSDKTIRDAYRALTATQKAAIIATREEKDNAYRMFSGNTTSKEEFILTKKGWISAKRGDYPICYGLSKDGTVYFMGSTGNIFYDSEDIDDYHDSAITVKWKSIPFDVSTVLSEAIQGNQRIVLRSVWVKYISAFDITFNIYLDGSATAARTKTLSKSKTYDMIMMPSYTSVVNSCRLFELYFQSELDEKGGANGIRIKSIGVIFKVIGTGLYG